MLRGRPPKPRPAAGMAGLERFAKRYRPRAEKLERQLVDRFEREGESAELVAAIERLLPNDRRD